MKILFLPTILITTLLLTSHVQAETIDDLQKAALQGDYSAQRNLAYLLFHGDSDTQIDKVQACLWREVILQSGYVSVHAGDVANRNTECGALPGKDRTAVRAKAIALSQDIYQKLAPKTPGFGESVWDDDFFGEDEKTNKQLVMLERKAFSGDTQAQRELATLLSSQAAADALWFNYEEEACVWWRVVAKGINGHPTKADGAAVQKACGSLSPDSLVVSNARFARVSYELERLN